MTSKSPINAPSDQKAIRNMLLAIAALGVLMFTLQLSQSLWQKQQRDRAALEWLPMCSVNGAYWVKLDAQGNELARRNTAPDQ